MKIISTIVRAIVSMVLMTYMAALTTFFLAIFMPENVMTAIEMVKNLIGG